MTNFLPTNAPPTAAKSPRLDTTMATFHSTDSTSSQASRKFKLDEHDKHDIFVYKLHGGYHISSQADLCKELDKDPGWRCSRKPIPRGTSGIEVDSRDCFNEPEKTAYASYPSTNLASIALPSSVYWRRMLFGHFKDLYIVSPEGSPESSPASSANNSVPNSDRPSPASTWDSQNDTAEHAAA